MALLTPRKGLTKGEYWSRPVPGFGDQQAKICIVGLAPGAHGANRTGRPFTGDGAGDFMYPLLHAADLANQSHSLSADDNFRLNDVYITNAVKCLPPENRPVAEEFAACRPFLLDELSCLTDLRVIVALGRGAFVSLLQLFKSQGLLRRVGDFPFGHQCSYRLPNGMWLVGCYHTSRYNVQTGRISGPMFKELLQKVKQLARQENG